MISIRDAKPGDEQDIFRMIKELAVYEKESQESITNTAVQLGCDLFEDRICHAIVVESDGEIIGFALYYIAYSTWKGKCLYLEDLYVQEDHRSCGVGGMLFDRIINIAKGMGVKRMDWQVLRWNQLAIDFYKKYSAVLDDGWMNGRLFF